VSVDRRLLEDLEPSLRQWGDGQACAMLALLARQSMPLTDEEVSPALRRALLVLAAGGDPHRELELDGPAVTGFAEDIDSRERRAQLQGALRDLHAQAEGLPRAAYLLEALLEDEELAWRSLTVALLAEELDEDAD
jgi:hypothetical protein